MNSEINEMETKSWERNMDKLAYAFENCYPDLPELEDDDEMDVVGQAGIIAPRTFEKVALSFATAIFEYRWGNAHEMLSTSLQMEETPESLRQRYDKMMSIYDADAKATSLTLIPDGCISREEAQVTSHWQDYDIGRAYVAIIGDAFNEAISMMICDDAGMARRQGPKLAIRKIEWGRP